MIRKIGHRWAVAAAVAVSLAALPAMSEARPYGHWHGGGWGWGWGPAVGVALGVDLALSAPYYYGYPPVVYASPPPVVVAQAPTTYVQAAPAPVVSNTAPDPVIYPRNGQSPAQTESDMRACNAWATSQLRAQADASVFQRATAACMDGRGYSIR